MQSALCTLQWLSRMPNERGCFEYNCTNYEIIPQRLASFPSYGLGQYVVPRARSHTTVFTVFTNK